MQTFTQQVQTPLSSKQKTYSEFFIKFLKSTWNLKHLQKKEECSDLGISEITYFRTALGNQRVNEFQTLL